ncbi:hypothetical protein E2C01_011773 [Portunus trituberculatus]|uniref:Uncharacterized protein n=1 Tax=Portunus trituberculatus TaxID=210409 RepID=A0A5B7DC00_PORTR|nr:hypothetical protein [Portunus trituberculatus]
MTRQIDAPPFPCWPDGPESLANHNHTVAPTNYSPWRRHRGRRRWHKCLLPGSTLSSFLSFPFTLLAFPFKIFPSNLALPILIFPFNPSPSPHSHSLRLQGFFVTPKSSPSPSSRLLPSSSLPTLFFTAPVSPSTAQCSPPPVRLPPPSPGTPVTDTPIFAKTLNFVNTSSTLPNLLLPPFC